MSKSDLATKFGVSSKTIQRDIEDLRTYLADNYQTDIDTDIVYDSKSNSYRLLEGK